MPLDTEPTCALCGEAIYRRPNCKTCSAACSRTLRALKAIDRPGCIVCGQPIPARRGGRARTCSNACSMARARQHDRKRTLHSNPDADSPPEPQVSAMARWFASMRFAGQRRGYAPRWGA